MRRRAYKLCAALAAHNYDYGIETVEQTIITNIDARLYLDAHSYDRLFMAPYDETKTPAENISEAGRHIHDLFDLWSRQNDWNISRLYRALYEEYDPLENYDRKEDGGWTDAHHKGTRTAVNRSETLTPNTTTTDTPRAKIKTSVNEYGINSAEGVPTTESTTEGIEGTNTTTVTGTTTTTADASENYSEVTDVSADVFDKDVREMNSYRVHGNIGVTKPSDMIVAEIEVRKKALGFMLLDMWVNEYTFYCDALEVVE